MPNGQTNDFIVKIKKVSFERKKSYIISGYLECQHLFQYFFNLINKISKNKLVSWTKIINNKFY